jgi:hypothetical protein
MKKELPIGRSTSNFLLKAMTIDKKNAQFSRVDLNKVLHNDSNFFIGGSPNLSRIKN